MLTQRRWIGVALLAVTVSAFTFTRSAVESVAVVVQVSGKVEIQRANAKPLSASVGLALLPGDKVVVPTGAKAVVMYRTGQMQTASQALTITEPAKKDAGSLYSRTVNTITQVASTDAAKQPNRQGMIRPVEGAAAPISPRNAVTVLDVRPQLMWFSIRGAEGYTVQLRRADIQGSKPVRFTTGTDSTWSYPASLPALVPGATYEWTVAAKNGRVAATQTFKVITPAKFESIANTMEQLQAAGLDPATDGLFILALAYRDAGLMYEANSALARLDAMGDGKGRVYHLLRGEVLDALGNLEAASREFVTADSESGA
jgi:hypothetical protein